MSFCWVGTDRRGVEENKTSLGLKIKMALSESTLRHRANVIYSICAFVLDPPSLNRGTTYLSIKSLKLCSF